MKAAKTPGQRIRFIAQRFHLGGMTEPRVYCTETESPRAAGWLGGRSPSVNRAKQSRKAAHNALTWYIEDRWAMVLDQILERVYVMRCQLVHGAATYGGKLNRTSREHCVTMMQRLLPALLGVWIDHGADQDWGPMCYSPVSALPGAVNGNGRPGRPK
jgi:hypothetical protein